MSRPVTLGDMQPYHLGKPARCLCRGSGVLTAWRGKERGIALCERMLAGFRHSCGKFIENTPEGTHWKAGQAPEEVFGGKVAE